MKSYPSTSITRLSGDILADAASSPVMITKYRKPGFVIMSAETYANLTRKASREDVIAPSVVFASAKTDGDDRNEALERDVIALFADRRIGREEAEDRTGLHFSEILVRMGELGIKRKKVDIHERMTPAQRKLFDEVFPA